MKTSPERSSKQSNEIPDTSSNESCIYSSVDSPTSSSANSIVDTSMTPLENHDKLDIQQAQKRKWSQMVPGVSQLKNMIISDDMLRGIRYCIEWLQYAAAHIDSQMSIIISYLAAMGISLSNKVSNAIEYYSF
jgi:hypothetical protein